MSKGSGSGASASERIYYTDSYAQGFSARVLEVVVRSGSPGVILDRTCFYPESGGQRADLGEVARQRVVGLLEEGESIVHLLDGPPPPRGTKVEGRIDWERRFDHMQQHTGQHILSQAFVEVAGAATEGFHMSEEVSTIDLDVESLTSGQLELVELRANQIVFQDLPVEVRFVEADEQESLGLRRLSSRQGTLRIIQIGDFDRSACGGTHCRRTGEVGLIKIRRIDRVRQKARSEFVSGGRALRDYQRKTEAIGEIARLLSVAEADASVAVDRQLEQSRTLRNQLARAQDALLEFEAERALRSAVERSGQEVVRGVWDGLDPKQLNRLASLILGDAPNRVVLLASRGVQGHLLFARSGSMTSLDLRSILAEAAAHCGGRGGGTPERAQAGSCNPDDLEAALDLATAAVGRK